MKKLTILLLSLLVSAISFAGDFGKSKIDNDSLKLENQANSDPIIGLGSTPKRVMGKEIISSGFYLNLGIASPSYDFYNSGIQPNLEIGNQWYFAKKETWGVGMNISWLQLGYNSFEYGGGGLGLHLIKIGPMGSYAINENMAIDAFINLDPTVYVFVGGDYEEAAGLWAPAVALGAKFRFKKFAAGFEYSAGNFNYVDSETEYYDGLKIKVNTPRFYLGFKF